jgi:hypothetical protein
MYDLYEELQTKLQQLDIAIKQLRKHGTEYAEAEKDYKIKLREEILRERENGTAVGIIDKICYGIPSVAQLRLKRDICEATYKANQEAILSLKLQCRLLDNQISREYGNVNNTGV